MTGRLATVEPGNRRLTIVPTGEIRRVEFFVAEDGEVLHVDRKLTLPDLVIQVGRRVTITYRVEPADGMRRVAMRIIVQPD